MKIIKNSAKKCALIILTLFLIFGFHQVAAKEQVSTNNLENATNPAAIEYKYFPDHLHAFVWRNWESVSAERMAKTINTTTENIRKIGLSMGLPSNIKPADEFMLRGYVTIIRHNWHLLPIEQLLILLDWSREKFDFHMKEDDFLFIKLGVKPFCEPIKYTQPDEVTKKRCAEIKAAVVKYFGDEINKHGEPRFKFVKTLSKVDPRIVLPSPAEDNDGQMRFIYSYFALYGDPLLNPELDPFPDGMLQRFAQSGVNGVWMHVVLRQLSPPTKLFPEFGEGYQTRLKNLQNLVERANRYGIKIYLYISEPRAMPPEFFKGREYMKGSAIRDYYSLCTSVPEVRQWVTDSLEYVFKDVPVLGGVFTISKCENPTNCYSDCIARDAKGCPRCSKRSGPEVISEINSAIAAGVWKGNPKAKVIIWDQMWPEDWVEPIISGLPSDAYLMIRSERGKPIVRGGIESIVWEYSLSAVGPSQRAKDYWAAGRKHGMKTAAKIQVNNSWELSTVPYLPVLNLAAKHCENLSKENIDAFMLSWTLGGCPSPNLKLVKLFSQRPAPTIEQALSSIAAEYYGAEAVPDILDAWSKFSDAFTEFPFNIRVLHLSPVQLGPVNLLYTEPTGYNATMVGFPYDDLEFWRGPYPADIFANQFEKVAAGWQPGIESFKNALSKKMTPAQQVNAKGDFRLAEAVYFYMKSAANQVRFTMARNELLSGKITAEQRQDKIKIIKDIVTEEIQLAKKLYILTKEDSRIGFEASNQCHYLPLDLVEKVIDCDYILNVWLPKQI